MVIIIFPFVINYGLILLILSDYLLSNFIETFFIHYQIFIALQIKFLIFTYHHPKNHIQVILNFLPVNFRHNFHHKIRLFFFLGLYLDIFVKDNIRFKYFHGGLLQIIFEKFVKLLLLLFVYFFFFFAFIWRVFLIYFIIVIFFFYEINIFSLYLGIFLYVFFNYFIIYCLSFLLFC